MKTITGGCLCGAVRYEARGEPLFAVYCHCRDCQRASGSGHVPVMGVPKELFTASGATTSYTAAAMNGRKSVRHFCPTCGSLLFGTSDAAPDAVSVYVGTLDDSARSRGLGRDRRGPAGIPYDAAAAGGRWRITGKAACRPLPRVRILRSPRISASSKISAQGLACPVPSSALV